MRTSFTIAILVALFVLTTGAWAGSVTIYNPNFDIPTPCPSNNCAATGWTSNDAAVWAPAAGTFNNPSGSSTQMPANNFQALWINTGWAEEVLDGTNGTTLSQLAADTTYTLQVYVGLPSGLAFGGVVELLAGGHIVATSASQTQIQPTNKNWQLWTLTFDSAGSAYVGDTLAIYLGSTTVQTDFDNVSLTYNADQGGGGDTPEPAMFALVGAGLLGLVARRRFAK